MKTVKADTLVTTDVRLYKDHMLKYTAILEAERTVVGCLLLDNGLLRHIELNVGDFTNPHCSTIFTAITEMAARNQCADIITVAEHLETQNKQKWLSIVGSFANNALRNQNIIDYAAIIKRESIKRLAVSVADGLIKNIADPAVVDNAIRSLMQLNYSQKNYECTLVDAVAGGITEIEEAMKSGGRIGITTGIAGLDDTLSGFRNTDLYVIGASTSTGKTAFMCNLIDACGVTCGFFSGEQGREQIGLRALSINGGIDSYRLRTAKLEEYEWAMVTKTVMNLTQKPTVYMDDRPSPGINDIVRQARKWKYQHDIKIIYIDYLQRITSGKGERKFEKMEDVVVQLKTLARELKIPIVVLSQISREAGKRPNKRPYLHDLADSSAIEKEADVVITIYREEVLDKETDQKGIAELAILKNRHGPTAMIRVNWEESVMRFKD